MAIGSFCRMTPAMSNDNRMCDPGCGCDLVDDGSVWFRMNIGLWNLSKVSSPGRFEGVSRMKLLAWMSAAVLALTMSAAEAQMPPAPEPLAPMPEGTIVHSVSEPITLFECVKYKDQRNIHPCAVEKIIAVADPCKCNDPCNCCGPKCVYVKVCVPPCDCYETKCKRNGNKLIMDFGKYQVEVLSARGQVIVDYDD